MHFFSTVLFFVHCYGICLFLNFQIEQFTEKKYCINTSHIGDFTICTTKKGRGKKQKYTNRKLKTQNETNQMHITNQSYRIQVCKLKSKHTEFEWCFFLISFRKKEQKVTKHKIVRANESFVCMCVCLRAQQ